MWAVIIAISNILIAIKPFLLHDRKTKNLREKLSLLESIQIEYEQLWHNYESKRIDENYASDNFFTIYEKEIKALRVSDNILLGIDKRLKKKANCDTDRYIYNNYQTKTD